MKFMDRRQRLGLQVFGLLGLMGLLGCNKDSPVKPTGSTNPYQGQEVDIVVPQALNLRAQWEVLIHEWSSQSGATPHFVEYDASKPVSAEVLSNVRSGGSFVLFPLEHLCEIESNLANLAVSGHEEEMRDVFKGLRERILSRDGKVIAGPISAPILVCYVRSDLLKAAGRKPPQTWEEYHDLVANIDSWAPGLTAVEPLNSEFRATTFFARSLAYSKHPENYSVWFDLDSAKPTVNSPGFEKAAEVAQKTWRLLPADVLNYSPADCRRLILSGKAAIGLSYEPGGIEVNSSSKSDETSARIDGIEIGVVSLPGSKAVYNRNSKRWDTLPSKSLHTPAMCGFAGLAAGVVAPKGSSGDLAATNLLASLIFSENFDRAFAKLTKGPCRESQVGSAAAWFGPDLSADEANRYSDEVAQSFRDTQVVYELPIAGSHEFRQAASAALEPLIKGEATPDQALATMQQSFEGIVERRGAKSIRDTHRRGLGMAPSMKE